MVTLPGWALASAALNALCPGDPEALGLLRRLVRRVLLRLIRLGREPLPSRLSADAKARPDFGPASSGFAGLPDKVPLELVERHTDTSRLT
jgi:hypothetical protein